MLKWVSVTVVDLEDYDTEIKKHKNAGQTTGYKQSSRTQLKIKTSK